MQKFGSYPAFFALRAFDLGVEFTDEENYNARKIEWLTEMANERRTFYVAYPYLVRLFKENEQDHNNVTTNSLDSRSMKDAKFLISIGYRWNNIRECLVLPIEV